jgi:hypothetical protein
VAAAGHSTEALPRVGQPLSPHALRALPLPCAPHLRARVQRPHRRRRESEGSVRPRTAGARRAPGGAGGGIVRRITEQGGAGLPPRRRNVDKKLGARARARHGARSGRARPAQMLGLAGGPGPGEQGRVPTVHKEYPFN